MKAWEGNGVGKVNEKVCKKAGRKEREKAEGKGR